MFRSTVKRSAFVRNLFSLGGSGALVVACMALFTMPVHAYLDPASGSMFLQLILGGLAGVAVLVKLYWHKFLGLFGVKKHGNDEVAD